MTENDSDADVLLATDLAARIKPLLAGRGPGVQGAALVELVALHLAGHPEQAREHVLTLHIDAVRQMVPVMEHELFGKAGHPGNINGG